MKRILTIALGIALLAAPAMAQNTATGTLTITAVPALTVKSTAISCTVGEACAGTLQATGGVSPYTWKIASGTAPAGFVLNTDGSFAWTPSAAVSAAKVTVQVTDSSGHSVTVSWNAGKCLTGSCSPAAGYDVYRGAADCGTMTRQNGKPITGMLYDDVTVAAGQSYCYGATAQDAEGRESAMSNTSVVKVPVQ